VTPTVAAVFEPGLLSSQPVQTAAIVGAVVSAVTASVGVFTVIRGQAFAGEALGDIGTTGGSAAFLAGAGPLWGFLAAGLAAAGVMEAIGVQRARGRDLATGVVLGAALALAALFLYWDTTYHSASGTTVTILFGSAFAIAPSTIPTVIALGCVVVAIITIVYRPLLLSSVSADLAASRGTPVRLIGASYLAGLAIAAALAALTVGTILSTALLIGPAATALRITKRPGLAVLTAALIGTLAMWIGIVLAYDSYYWPPHGHGWPVSFFVVTLILCAYLTSNLAAAQRLRRGIREPSA
jgi:zinc/manganese transport system permease protein